MTYQAPRNGFRTFLIVWASQSVSVFGSSLTFFAINIWLVESLYPRPEQQPQLAWALAAIGLAMMLPNIVAMPVAGVLADRMDRKRLMMTMDLTNGLLVTLFCVLMATGRLQLWMLLSGMVLFAVTSAIHGSAFDTSYAMLVTDEQLPRANGMMQTMWSLSSLLAPAAAATIIALPVLARAGSMGGTLGRLLGTVKEGAALAIGIDAATFYLAAAVLAFLTIPSPSATHAAGERSSIWADVRLGVVYIWRRKPLLWLLATFAVVNLCTPLGVFLPLLVKVDLAGDVAARGYSFETALAVINSVMAAGGIAGGSLVSLWGGLKRRRVIGLMAAILLQGVGMLMMGFTSMLFTVAAFGCLLNFANPIGNAHSQAIWQGQVPRELQGRVFAVRRVLSSGLMPLSQVLAGWMAGVMDPGRGVALLGGVIAVVSVIQLLNPYMLKVEDSDYLNRMAAD